MSLFCTDLKKQMIVAKLNKLERMVTLLLNSLDVGKKVV